MNSVGSTYREYSTAPAILVKRKHLISMPDLEIVAWIPMHLQLGNFIRGGREAS